MARIVPSSREGRNRYHRPMTTDPVRSAPAASPAPGPSTPAHKKAGAGAAERIRTLWHRLSPLPGGRFVFSKLVGWNAPYTGSMGARVEELSDGYARATLEERRRVRNHLRSVHAVALVNLAELVSGLAMVYSMDSSLRGIVTHLEMDYHKKARGLLTATCRVPDLASLRSGETGEREVPVEIHDPDGDLVATARARWLLGK